MGVEVIAPEHKQYRCIPSDPCGGGDLCADEFVRTNGHKPEREGAIVLDAVSSFLARFVAFPSPAAHVATTLWVAHSHMVDVFESTPRLACSALNPAPGKPESSKCSSCSCPDPNMCSTRRRPPCSG
jgi:hypothetical protein